MKNILTQIKRNMRLLDRAVQDFKDAFKTQRTTPEETKGKRILILNWRDTKHAYAGGAEVYIHELAKRWVAQGDTVTLFCGSDGKSRRNEVLDGVEVIRRGGFYFVYIWALVYYLFRFRGKYDVIVDCENGIPFFSPLYTRKKTFLVIHHVHQEIFRKNLRPPFSWLALLLESKVMPFVYRNVQIITVSESSKQDILHHRLTKIEPLVIHNGIDQEAYQPGKKASRPLILYVGRLQSYKSLHVFLHAARTVLRDIPNAQFVIAGDGEERTRLHVLTRKLHLTDAVYFMGRVSQAEKIRLYKKAWVFVNPSLREGWGLTTIEANACGTPVIASNVAGLRDSIQHNETGLLVAYGQSDAFAKQITRVIKETPLREQLAAKAMIWSRTFNWDISASTFSALMTEESVAPSRAPLIIPRLSYLVNKLHSFLF